MVITITPVSIAVLIILYVLLLNVSYFQRMSLYTDQVQSFLKYV